MATTRAAVGPALHQGQRAGSTSIRLLLAPTDSNRAGAGARDQGCQSSACSAFAWDPGEASRERAGDVLGVIAAGVGGGGVEPLGVSRLLTSQAKSGRTGPIIAEMRMGCRSSMRAPEGDVTADGTQLGSQVPDGDGRSLQCC